MYVIGSCIAYNSMRYLFVRQVYCSVI